MCVLHQFHHICFWFETHVTLTPQCPDKNLISPALFYRQRNQEMMAVEELINSMFLEMPTLKLSEFQVKL